MSEKPEKQKKKKKEHSASTGVRKFLMVLLSIVALFMTVLVIYTLKYSTTDPTVAEGKTNVWAPEESTAATDTTIEIEVTEPTEPENPALYEAQRELDTMSLEEKVYQLFFVTNRELTGEYYASTAGEETRAALETKPVGGIVFDSDNIFDSEQLKQMIADSQSYSKLPLFIGVEEEGGFNSYLNKIGVTRNYSEMGVYGDENDTQRVYEIGNEIGTAITGIGFNIDLAPVADSLTNIYNTEIARRAFSTDPNKTASMVMQMVKGLHSANCMACLKYFPGLSASNMDSRYGTAVSNQTYEELNEYMLPFIIGIENGAEMVMVSHLCLPNIVGENRPADLCPEIVDGLLRDQLGFDGVVMTDSFQKGAISYNYDVGEAAVAAINAGCDIIYMPDDLDIAAEAIIDAVDSGLLTEERINESVLRILILKYNHGLL